MKKFTTSRWSDTIEEIEVTRETEKCYFTPAPRGKEYRSLKNQDYHDTWENAHSYLLQRSDDAVASAHNRLDRAIAVYNKVKAMTRP